MQILWVRTYVQYQEAAIEEQTEFRKYASSEV